MNQSSTKLYEELKRKYVGVLYHKLRECTGEIVNIHIQSLINILQENNWEISTKIGKGKLTLFCGNGERVITFCVPW